MKLKLNRVALNIIGCAIILALTIGWLFTLNMLQDGVTREDEYQTKIDSLNTEVSNHKAIESILLKSKRLSDIKLKELIEKKPEVIIKHKYEKITDTIYMSPIKRDSILSIRLQYYIQNRSRFSAEGFNVGK
jgi:hypothetical protein